MELARATDRCEEIINSVREHVIIDDTVLEEILVGFLADGHVLLEDVPGTGKTLTARTIADALGLEFSRIQFTPDLLPADITGFEVFNEREREFEFQKGPLFANIVLADEINRASPKTQSALLEAMSEGQVSIGNQSHGLPSPFFVIATQNPVESTGTFELPEAQKDRFMIKTSLGYPEPEGEVELLHRRSARNTRSRKVDAVCSAEEINELRHVQERVEVDKAVQRYITDVARATRGDERVFTGVSPRGTERLFEAARATAVIRGRDFVTPDDVRDVIPPVVTHRITLTPESRVAGIDRSTVVDEVQTSVPVPKLLNSS